MTSYPLLEALWDPPKTDDWNTKLHVTTTLIANDSIVGVDRTSIEPSDLDICFERITLKSHPSFCAALIISHTLGT